LKLRNKIFWSTEFFLFFFNKICIFLNLFFWFDTHNNKIHSEELYGFDSAEYQQKKRSDNLPYDRDNGKDDDEEDDEKKLTGRLNDERI